MSAGWGTSGVINTGFSERCELLEKASGVTASYSGALSTRRDAALSNAIHPATERQTHNTITSAIALK